MHVIFTRYFNPAAGKEYFPGDILTDVDAFTFDYLTLNRYAKNYTIPQSPISKQERNPIKAGRIFFETLALGMSLVLLYIFTLSLPMWMSKTQKVIVIAQTNVGDKQ